MSAQPGELAANRTESGPVLLRTAVERAALRRVAMLVARGAPPKEVFGAVTEEVGRLQSVDYAGLGRYESDGAVACVAAWGTARDQAPAGQRWTPDAEGVGRIVFETGCPARVESIADLSGQLGVSAPTCAVGSGVGTPVIVEGRLWGVLITHSVVGQPLPPSTEARLADFTELVATAIGNSESRAQLARLAEEQAALRRVATLVAAGTASGKLFAAVAEEVAKLLAVTSAAVGRYELDGTVTSVAAWGTSAVGFPVGSLCVPGGKGLTTMVFETGRPARIDHHTVASGSPGVAAGEAGFRSAVATPITVEGRLWGVVVAGTSGERPLPADTEARLANFTKLVATAIANAESRVELMASRARVVAASDEARRRIGRDLHDGTQQRLVSLGLELRAVQAAVPAQLGELEGALSRVVGELGSVFDELREISFGIHPAILSEGGLEAALRALRRRSAVPVELDLHIGRRLPQPVEVAAYYVVSEALTNVAKHSHANVVNVELDTEDTIMQLAIRDDGIGGAHPNKGSGLLGLTERIEALGGTLQVTSPSGGGTTLLIEVPLEDQSQGPSAR